MAFLGVLHQRRRDKTLLVWCIGVKGTSLFYMVICFSSWKLYGRRRALEPCWVQYVHKNEQPCIISFVSHHPNVLKIHIKNHICNKLSLCRRANVLKILEKRNDMHVNTKKFLLYFLCTFQESPNVLSFHTYIWMYVCRWFTFVWENPKNTNLDLPNS
jgi:hypothetical protein